MATISLKAYESSVSVLTTELNSLANNNVSGVSGSGSGTILDNTSLLDLYADFVLTVTFGSAPVAGVICGLYYAASPDGTNYTTAPAAGTTLPNSTYLVGNFTVQTTGTAQVLTILRFPLIPGKMKFQLVNAAGVAFPASGSTVVAYRYNLQSV